MAFDSILSRICFIISLLLIVFIQKNSSKEVGLLDDGLDTICLKEVTRLKNGGDSVLIVHDGGALKSHTGRFPFQCKFKVKAKEDEGLYVVIQELNFREGVDDAKCLDYVELSIPPNNIAKLLFGDNRKVEKFCGNLSPGVWLQDEDELISNEERARSKKVAPNAYVAPDGTVAVEIFVGARHSEQKLVMRLAFTSFKKRKSCSEGNYCRLGECIDSSLFYDGTQNCPYETCADEDGCKAFQQKTDDWPQTVAGTGIGTKVTFGAVGALLLILLKFGLCLWLCKRLHRRRARQRAAAIPVHPITRQASLEPQPSAPVLEELETKDLPPSYESLYPDGPRTETHT